MKKIPNEVKEKAIELRRKGTPYREIAEQLNLSLTWCKVNLQEIPSSSARNGVTEEERESAIKLRENGWSYLDVSRDLDLPYRWCKTNLKDVVILRKREYPKSSSDKQFVVYIAHDGSDAVYVGEGKHNREQHVNSGVSHVYELNKDHFNGLSYAVEVIYLKDKETAEELEDIFIEEFKPKYNRRLPLPNETRTKTN